MLLVNSMQGLLLIDKPIDITSYKAVAIVKHLSGEKRVGHTGTLDPMATGVLPVFLGRATLLSSFLLEADKQYIATIRLGIATDTCDITGNIENEFEVNVTDADIFNILEQFRGDVVQTPPMYSALKQNGMRLCDLARKGIKTQIPARLVNIKEIEILTGLNGENEFTIKVTVSKGTYIRSLARDIGEALGCGGCLTSLQRIFTGGFSINDCVDLNALTAENISNYILPAEKAVEHFRVVNITEGKARRFKCGGELDLSLLDVDNAIDDEIFRVKYNDSLIGLGQADLNKNQLKIKCLLEL